MIQNYDQIRPLMRPGDVIAFGGKGRFSQLIKLASRSKVSHVGTILRTSSIDEHGTDRYFNMLIESTTLGKGVAGVVHSRLSKRLENYDGEAWWLPLADPIRASLNVRRFTSFLMEAEGRPYDYLQALGSILEWIPHTHEDDDYAAFFCSELVAGAYRESGVLGESIVPESINPHELIRMPIFEPYVQLCGEKMAPI